MESGILSCLPRPCASASACSTLDCGKAGAKVTPKPAHKAKAPGRTPGYFLDSGQPHLDEDVALANAVAEAVAGHFESALDRIEERMDTMMGLMQGEMAGTTRPRVPTWTSKVPAWTRNDTPSHSDRKHELAEWISSPISKAKEMSGAKPPLDPTLRAYMQPTSETLKSEPPQNIRVAWLADVVESQKFGNFCVLVILCNSITTIVSTNWAADHLTAKLPTWMLIAEMCFLAWYTAEISLKAYVHRMHLLYGAERNWNIFDILVVVAGVTEVAMQTIELDFTFMRVLRILRVIKSFRALKAIPYLQELKLMLNCVLNSLLSLFWAILLMSLFLIIAAMIFVQTITNFQIDHADTTDAQLRDSLTRTYGSVGKAMMTTFQATTGGVDWADTYEVLSHTGPLSCMLFIIYLIFFIFALSNVVTSIFVDQALQLAKPDLEWRMFDKKRDEAKCAKDLRILAEQLDVDNSNTIGKEELMQLTRDPQIRRLFQLFDIEISDVQLFYQMITSLLGTQELDIDSFVASCLKMKGNASSADVQMLIFQTKSMQKTLAGVSDRLHTLEATHSGGSE